MGADPNSGRIYTPEERAQLDEATNERLVDVSRQEYEQLREMSTGERVAFLAGRGKDRSGARKGQAAKARAKRRRKHRQ